MLSLQILSAPQSRDCRNNHRRRVLLSPFVTTCYQRGSSCSSLRWPGGVGRGLYEPALSLVLVGHSPSDPPQERGGGVLIGWGRVKGKWPVFLCAASTWLCRGDSLDSEADRLDLLPQSLSLSRGGSLQSSATQPVSPVWHWRVRTSFSLHLEPGKRAWALRYRQACPGTTA